MLLLKLLAAVASNDFADEIEYLKLLNMMVIVSSSYYEKDVFQQSNELDPKNFFRSPWKMIDRANRKVRRSKSERPVQNDASILFIVRERLAKSFLQREIV